MLTSIITNAEFKGKLPVTLAVNEHVCVRVCAEHYSTAMMSSVCYLLEGAPGSSSPCSLFICNSVLSAITLILCLRMKALETFCVVLLTSYHSQLIRLASCQPFISHDRCGKHSIWKILAVPATSCPVLIVPKYQPDEISITALHYSHAFIDFLVFLPYCSQNILSAKISASPCNISTFK